VDTVEVNVGDEDSGSGLTPFTRWAGGKRKLAPQLASEIIAVKPALYLEPFLGGGAVALALPQELPKILADINQHLIDCWLCVQRLPAVLFAELREVEHAYGNHLEGYLEARNEFNAKVSHPRLMWPHRSALFLYLNARCFNGLWRTNARGFFNVPFGKLEAPRVLSVNEITGYSIALKKCDLRSDGFIDLLGKEFTKRSNRVCGALVEMKKMFRGVALYIDPPYDGTFDGYTKGKFSSSDQQVLAGTLHSHAVAGAAVWATNSDTPMIRELYKWAQIEEIDEHHSVGSKAERRGKRGCVLIRGGAACGS